MAEEVKDDPSTNQKVAKAVILPRLREYATIGTPKEFRVIRGPIVISKIDLKGGAVRNVSIDLVTWDKFMGREYDFDLVGSVTNTILDAVTFDYSCVTDIKL